MLFRIDFWILDSRFWIGQGSFGLIHGRKTKVVSSDRRVTDNWCQRLPSAGDLARPLGRALGRRANRDMCRRFRCGVNMLGGSRRIGPRAPFREFLGLGDLLGHVIHDARQFVFRRVRFQLFEPERSRSQSCCPRRGSSCSSPATTCRPSRSSRFTTTPPASTSSSLRR